MRGRAIRLFIYFQIFSTSLRREGQTDLAENAMDEGNVQNDGDNGLTYCKQQSTSYAVDQGKGTSNCFSIWKMPPT